MTEPADSGLDEGEQAFVDFTVAAFTAALSRTVPGDTFTAVFEVPGDLSQGMRHAIAEGTGAVVSSSTGGSTFTVTKFVREQRQATASGASRSQGGAAAEVVGGLDISDARVMLQRLDEMQQKIERLEREGKRSRMSPLRLVFGVTGVWRTALATWDKFGPQDPGG